MLLHILWMILKIILIILGAVLGLLFLIILLLLFCPVRYKGEVRKGEKSSDIQAHTCISWLFHGISVCFQYEDRQFTNRIRIVGIPLDWIQKKGKIFFRKKNHPGKDSQILPAAEKDLPEEDLDSPPVIVAEKKEVEKEIKRQFAVDKKADKPKRKQRSLFKKIKKRVADFKQKFRRICRTIRRICRKVEWWKAFFENPRIKAALFLVKQEVWKIVKHVLPVKINGKITFGCEDPSVTGMILAILGITIPLHKNCIEITPLYSGENFFTGNIFFAGRFYGIVFLLSAVKIYFNKNIKYAISRWKHKEG